MLNILKAIKALAMFERYTDMPRILEIGYSLLFWSITIFLINTILRLC